MNIEIGWYRTVGGERAFIAAIVPQDLQSLGLVDRYYAIGWIVMNVNGADCVCPVWWNREGKLRHGNEVGPDFHDLASREIRLPGSNGDGT